MRKGWAVVLAGVVLAMPLGLRAQADDAVAKHASPPMDDTGEKNAAKARAALDAMVKALGGDAWLNDEERRARGAYCGVPSWRSRSGYDAVLRISPVARSRSDGIYEASRRGAVLHRAQRDRGDLPRREAAADRSRWMTFCGGAITRSNWR